MRVMLKKVTVGSPIVALLLLAGASMSPLRAATVYIFDTEGIAFTESGKTNPYAVFINPSDPGDAVGVCCGPSSTILYQVIDITDVEVSSTMFDLSFEVQQINGTTNPIKDIVQLDMTLGLVGMGPYYGITSLTNSSGSSTGCWNAVNQATLTCNASYAISLDNTTIINDGPSPSGYTVDNLFDPTGVVPSPEPGSVVLLATGLLAMLLTMRKRVADRIRQATRTQR